MKELEEVYKKAYKDLSSDFIRTYQEVVIDGAPQISKLYELNRYYKLLAQVKRRLVQLGIEEIDIIGVELRAQADSFSLLDSTLVEEIVNQVWCGDHLDWTERITRKKEEMAQTLMDVFSQAIIQGKSISKTEKVLKERFAMGERQAERIVRTETSHIYNRCSLEKYREAGLTQYQVLTAHDSRVCDQDSEMDGKIFNIDEAVVGVNLPPFHPNCRCTTKGVVNIASS